jgi:serine/threonine protein kinase
MNLFKYVQKTINKGSFFVKFIKLIRFFQHSFYGLCRLKIGDYPAPSAGTRDIGFFDKNRRIHTADQNRYFFKKENLYHEGRFTHMKPGAIAIAEIDGDLLLKKTFKGIQKYNKFYNELICLNRLKNMKEIPKVIFADYKTHSVFMEFLDGEILSNEKDVSMTLSSGESRQFKNDFVHLLNRVHESGVLMYDLKGTNMMKSEINNHLIDFADSVYFGNRMSLLMTRHLEKEKSRMKNILATVLKQSSDLQNAG